jgi:hypothetical protein
MLSRLSLTKSEEGVYSEYHFEKTSRNLLKEFKYEWTGFGYKNIGGRKDRKLCWIGVKIKQFKPTEDDDQETLY